MLYEKCNQRGIASLVPVWNVAAFMNIVGRPGWHMIYLLVPVYNIYFAIKIFMELCYCFKRTKAKDYFFMLALNGFFVLNLGFSATSKYYGPVYEGPIRDEWLVEQEKIREMKLRKQRMGGHTRVRRNATSYQEKPLVA
ncbi:MAG: hypothetical protein COA57_05840 [Flavobacteriales bacterium]|nr:MAG: hypothetical protein COA57_05840 [Flavobacteriales bacterium]